MKWTVVFICVIGCILSKTEAVKLIQTNEEWISQVGAPPLKQDTCPDCKCGVPKTNSRIIGGTDATNGEAPWIGYLQAETDNGISACGCTVIKNKYALTAGHCIIAPAEKLSVILFVDDLDNTGNMMWKQIKSIIVHPDYNATGYLENDMAILEFNKPLDFTKPLDSDNYITPVCLAQPGTTFIGKDVTAMGWGLTKGINGTTAKVLQKVTFPAVKDQECTNLFGANYYQPDKKMCVGLKDGTKGVCDGDSGGPVHMYDDTTGVITQYGVASYVIDFCASYGVFTQVAAYSEWIEQNTSDGCGCAAPE